MLAPKRRLPTAPVSLSSSLVSLRLIGQSSLPADPAAARQHHVIYHPSPELQLDHLMPPVLPAFAGQLRPTVRTALQVVIANFIRLLPPPHKSLRPMLALLLLFRGPAGLDGKLRLAPPAAAQPQILCLQLGEAGLQSL